MTTRSKTGDPAGAGRRGRRGQPAKVLAGGVCLCLALSGCAGLRPPRRFDLGFLASRDTSPEGYARSRGAGPVLERQAAPDGRSFRAVRPVFSEVRDPVRERRLRDFLWPVGMIKNDRRDTFWRFLTAFGHDFNETEPGPRYRCAVLPVLFWGRDRDGQGYFAVFPLGGTIREFLGRDRIDFALFPLYARSAVNDVVTHDVLWPFLSRTRGGDVRRDKVFPFYGRSVNGPDWEKTFVLWPLWTSARYHYPASSGGVFILFPLFGRVNLTDQQGWMLLPPFFKWIRGERHREAWCPWPFVQYASGEFEKRYLWPLWGTRSAEGVRSWFALWPLISQTTVQTGPETTRRFFVVPFFTYTSRTQQTEGAPGEEAVVRARLVKLWPVFSYRRAEESARLRIPELWPFGRVGGVERNLAPLWTLYARVRVQGTVEHEVLWGLGRYRREADGSRRGSLFPLLAWETGRESRRWSFLLGLAGYERRGLRKIYRLLYCVRIRR